MNRTLRLLLGAALAATALAGPSAYGDDPEEVGTRCVLTAANDDTGLVQQDPNLRFGTLSTVQAGVDVVDDSSPGSTHATTTDVIVHCWVQVNSDAPGHFPIANAHCDFANHGLAGGTCQVEFRANASDNVFVCGMTETHGKTVVHDDDGEPANGAQCALQVSAGPPAPPERVRSAVVGYIRIDYVTATDTSPRVSLSGVLADSGRWSCTWPAYNPLAPFTVTCLPQPNVVLSWRCDVLHADAYTLSGQGRLRTSLDCDGGGPEAQTAIVSGTGGSDLVMAPSNVIVSMFRCTIDGGSTPQRPDFRAGCGDPGLVTPEWD